MVAENDPPLSFLVLSYLVVVREKIWFLRDNFILSYDSVSIMVIKKKSEGTIRNSVAGSMVYFLVGAISVAIVSAIVKRLFLFYLSRFSRVKAQKHLLVRTVTMALIGVMVAVSIVFS